MCLSRREGLKGKDCRQFREIDGTGDFKGSLLLRFFCVALFIAPYLF